MDQVQLAIKILINKIIKIFHEFLQNIKKNIEGHVLDGTYSRLPETQTLSNSNLPLTRSNFHFPSDRFLYNFTLDNSNCFFISLEGSNYRESTVLTKPFSPFYLEEMKNYYSLSVSRAVSQVIMWVHKVTVAYKLALQ